MRRAAATVLIMASLLLQGCVAAVIPVIAAGAIGKSQIDSGKDRARTAEEAFDREPQVKVEFPTDTPVEAASGDGAVSIRPSNLPAGDHPYLSLARYALEQAQRRTDGLPLHSALLIEQVSLTDPKTIDCGDRPLAVLIDLDPATISGDASPPAQEFGEIFGPLRDAGIVIAWIGDPRSAASAEALHNLLAGDSPVIADGDVQLLVEPGGMRKQEMRWNLARNYCVLAIAGDAKSDFDELFDYLRNPDYAIRLDKFIDKGWFQVPDPASLLGPANTSSEIEQPQ